MVKYIKWCHKHKLIVGFIALFIIYLVNFSKLYYIYPEAFGRLIGMYILLVWTYSLIAKFIKFINGDSNARSTTN